MKQKKTWNKNDIAQFRAYWFSKGYDLVNITYLCDLKLGNSGWCNDLNEPNEDCYHVQIWYRDEQIGVLGSSRLYTINEDKFIPFETDDYFVSGRDFIIFRKVKL
jgi:hypothetical protein